MIEKIKRLIASPDISDVQIGMELLIDYIEPEYSFNSTTLKDFPLYDEEAHIDCGLLVVKGVKCLWLGTGYIMNLKIGGKSYYDILKGWEGDLKYVKLEYEKEDYTKTASQQGGCRQKNRSTTSC